MSTSHASGESESAPVTAALTLSLTGRYRRQGIEAGQGVRLWAESQGAQLTPVDDGGSATTAVRACTGWLGTVDLLIGPYASGLVRAVTPHVRDAGQLLWNHGGSADDLAQPGNVTLVAPASSYFHGVIDEAIRRRIGRLLIVQGPGPFAASRRRRRRGSRSRARNRHGGDEIVNSLSTNR